MEKSSKKNRMKAQLLCLAIVLLIFSCTGIENKGDSVKSKVSYPPPVIVLLDTCPPPKVTRLKDVPSPLVLPVLKNSGQSYKTITARGGEKIRLSPPVVSKVALPEAHVVNFNTEHGLAIPGMWGGFMDKKGRLWFGSTGGGVSCYDGTGFSNYLNGSGVSCVAEDKRGWLWFGTINSGAICYDGARFTSYTTKEGLADNNVYSMVNDRAGNLWFATMNGISRFDGTKFMTIRPSSDPVANNVNMIAEDSKGNLWLVLFGGGVCRYNGKDFRFYTHKDGLPTNAMLSILEDSRGNFWFGSLENGVSRFDGTAFTTINFGKTRENNTVSDIEEDSNGDLWFATSGAGAIRYDGKEFTAFTIGQGLPSNVINSITKDKHGNLWFATSNGLSCYHGRAFTTFSSKQGLPQNYITSITEDEPGNLWLGTFGSGLIYYDGENFTAFTTEQGLSDNSTTSAIRDNAGNLWIGASNGGGVNRFDGHNLTQFTQKQGLADDALSAMSLDSVGNIWLNSSFNGVSRFDGKEFIIYTKAQGLSDNGINCITTDSRGNLWFGGQSGGVSCFDGKSFTTYTTAQGLAGDNVYGIEEDRFGNLWLATTTGLSRYDGSTLLSFNSTHGLPDDVVVNITEDESGTIWLGTNKGFCSLEFKTPQLEEKPGEIKGAGLFNISNEQLKICEIVWTIYNEKTGYPVKDMVYTGSMKFKKQPFSQGHIDKPGILWASSGNGKLIRFDPNSVKKNTGPAVPLLKNIRIGQQAVNWYDLEKRKKDSALISRQEEIIYGRSLSAKIRDSLLSKFSIVKFDSITPFYQLPLGLVLPYSLNHITIDYGAIETNRNFMVRYQYILEGYEKEWSPITDKTSASFGNISKGAYTFKLKTRSPEGVWSEPIEYSFKVLPPWWQTWWFRTLAGITLLLLFYGIYRWRTAALRKQKRILEQTVKVRTAEVEKRNVVIQKEKEKSDELLLNILPAEVADELKEKGYTTAKSFDEVTVLFSDIKGFTSVAEKLTAQELVKEIDIYFSAFDSLMLKHGLKKIKTIGDAYIAAGGLPEKNSASAQNVVEAAIDMQRTIQKLKQERILLNKPYFELRIGIHTGPVVAGVVGIKKFQYDIWGDTVNIAARMEQSGVPGRINISQHTYEMVKEQFTCSHRGKIDAKNKGEIDMYFVE